MGHGPPPPWVVVIAASSGGVKALVALVSSLPAHLRATVLVACHTPATSQRALPGILSLAGPLPASYPDDGQGLEAGRIFVAPPDRHLIVHGHRLHLTSGAKEHGLRPTADVLFRSVAREFGPRALGVVLSGGGHDGTEGLAAIQAAGGLVLVQSDHDAQLSTMPLHALAAVTPDACASARQLGVLVARFTAAERDSPERVPARSRAPRARQPPAAPRSLEGLRVFVAEDEYLIASQILGMLQTLGCGAAGTVSDVETGLRVLDKERGQLDCAVLDVDLRGRTVLPLAQALRGQGVPLVFATGYGRAVLPEAWAAAPRLQKPYDLASLAEALRLALSMRWPPLTPSSQDLAGIDYREETLKDSRNGVMRSRVLLTSSSNRRLLRSREALRRTDERLSESAVRKESLRRVHALRAKLRPESAHAEDEDE